LGGHDQGDTTGLPNDAGKSPETLRSHTLQVGEQLGEAAADKPPAAAAAAIPLTLESTFVRSREESERHLEVLVGNVETKTAGRQVFGAVTRSDTDITALIRRTLETVDRDDDTEVTAFTDGCPGRRTILANAGVRKPPILDWFHTRDRADTKLMLPTELLEQIRFGFPVHKRPPVQSG
jgi:hypothetical protein